MIETLSQVFLNTIKTYVKDDLLAAKVDGRYVPISTEEFARRVKHLSLGLADLGLGAGDKLVIFSENRPEWTITDFAVLCAGAVTVPIYTSLMPEQVKYIINDSDAKIVVCSNRTLWLKVEAVRARASERPPLRPHRRGRPAGRGQPVRGHGPGQGHRRRRPRAVREAGPGRQARRPGLHHLHLGHDRRPQGRHADPRQLRRQFQGPRRGHRVLGQGHRSCPSCRCPTSWSG
ncbi:MAG: AMP-binding protein [Comamonadaceae bacterium]|nr:AMP-binding protein [Comamonadaceae bacterium]